MALKNINVSNWQDYRGKSEGVLVYLNTSSQSDLPIRDIMDEFEKGSQTEPHYETGTFGLMSCVEHKLRAAIFKNRKRYIFFGTSYQGTNEEYKGKFLLTGYMRLDKYLDVRKRHMHQWMQQQEGEAPECVDAKESIAYYSSEMNFYAPEDCFELNAEVMQSWGYKGRIAKHMKLSFSQSSTQQVLEHFATKKSITEDYAKLSVEMEQERLEAEEEEDTEEW
jgi:hypothetical protein